MDRDELRSKLEFYRDIGVESIYRREPLAEPQPVVEHKPIAIPDPMPKIELIPIAPQDDTLEAISRDIGDCKRCRLCEGRNKIVFGSGDPQASLVFVGEAPGADDVGNCIESDAGIQAVSHHLGVALAVAIHRRSEGVALIPPAHDAHRPTAPSA